VTQRLVLTAPEPGELVVDDRVFTVRIGADLDVDVMAELLSISQEYRRYGNKPERLAEWIQRAKKLIFEIVDAEGPNEDDFAYLKRRAMSPSEALQIITLISGNPQGPEREVVDALGDGVPEGEGEPLTDPTRSQPRSRTRSSRSARRRASARATGEGSDGETSGSISRSGTAA
jgi:hypothetical protein